MPARPRLILDPVAWLLILAGGLGKCRCARQHGKGAEGNALDEPFQERI